MSERIFEADSVLDNVLAAAMMGVTIVFSPLLRDRYNRWGATEAEVRRALPGDELVPHPRSTYTRAITINAAPADIWPWLAQMGQEHGGLYSYTGLENLVGCKMRNAERIIPEWQQIRIGDPIRLMPKGGPLFKVVAIQPNRALVLLGADPKTEKVPELTDPMPAAYANSNWIFYLEPTSERQTRLIVRGSLDYEPANFLNTLIWRILTEPIGFLMIRKMLLGIKERAERITKRSDSAARVTA